MCKKEYVLLDVITRGQMRKNCNGWRRCGLSCWGCGVRENFGMWGTREFWDVGYERILGCGVRKNFGMWGTKEFWDVGYEIILGYGVRKKFGVWGTKEFYRTVN